jgi:transposase
MEAYSLDLRQWICAACDEQTETHQEVADRFGVGRWFVQKLLRQRRVEGTIAAKPRGRGPAATIGPADQQRLRKLVKANADATLSELCRLLHQTGGVAVNVWTMCRALKAMRLSHETLKRLAVEYHPTANFEALDRTPDEHELATIHRWREVARLEATAWWVTSPSTREWWRELSASCKETPGSGLAILRRIRRLDQLEPRERSKDWLEWLRDGVVEQTRGVVRH